MSKRALCFLVLFASNVTACDACQSATDPAVASGTTSAPEVEPREPAGAETPALDVPSVDMAPALVIGYAIIPRQPSEEAIAANRQGLALHGRGEFEGAAAAFRSATELEPSYLLARFNLACATSRLGHLDAARELLSELLALDLPTIGPRLDRDPDLAPLREGEHAQVLTALRARLAPSYDAALVEGVPMVRVAIAQQTSMELQYDSARTVQAGVWMPDARRFVPMAPPISATAPDLGLVPLAETVVDVALRVVIGFTGVGRGAEGADLIDQVEVTAFRAATGEELVRQTHPCPLRECVLPSLHASADGVVMSFVTDADYDTAIERAFGGAATFEPTHLPRIRCGQDGCDSLLLPSSDVTLERSGEEVRVSFGQGTESALPLDRAHALHRFFRGSPTVLSVRPADGVVWLATAERIDYDQIWTFGAAAVSRLSRDDERAMLVLGGRGAVALWAAPDGSVYAQVASQLVRYPPGSSEGEPLPEGLSLRGTPYRTAGRDVYRRE